jgi:hypothetical protein
MIEYRGSWKQRERGERREERERGREEDTREM